MTPRTLPLRSWDTTEPLADALPWITKEGVGSVPEYKLATHTCVEMVSATARFEVKSKVAWTISLSFTDGRMATPALGNLAPPQA